MEDTNEIPEFFRALRTSGRSNVASFNDYEERDTCMTVEEKRWLVAG